MLEVKTGCRGTYENCRYVRDSGRPPGRSSRCLGNCCGRSRRAVDRALMLEPRRWRGQSPTRRDVVAIVLAHHRMAGIATVCDRVRLSDGGSR